MLMLLIKRRRIYMHDEVKRTDVHENERNNIRLEKSLNIGKRRYSRKGIFMRIVKFGKLCVKAAIIFSVISGLICGFDWLICMVCGLGMPDLANLFLLCTIGYTVGCCFGGFIIHIENNRNMLKELDKEAIYYEDKLEVNDEKSND